MKYQDELKREKQFHDIFMKIAINISSLSRCKRRKVGAVIVLPDDNLIYGFNGSPKGTCNDCEENGITKPEVIHAEMNAIFKGNRDLTDSTLYVTTLPCIKCASALIQKGISRVYYLEEYHDLSSIEYLNKYGIKVSKYEL